MKKYIIKVTFKNGFTSIITTKAKDTLELDKKVAKYLNDTYSIQEVDHIEYDVVHSWTFKKKECYEFVTGTYVGWLVLWRLLNE